VGCRARFRGCECGRTLAPTPNRTARRDSAVAVHAADSPLLGYATVFLDRPWRWEAPPNLDIYAECLDAARGSRKYEKPNT
jgi:hypothetical protein